MGRLSENDGLVFKHVFYYNQYLLSSLQQCVSHYSIICDVSKQTLLFVSDLNAAFTDTDTKKYIYILTKSIVI